MTASPPATWAASITPAGSQTRPEAPGYCTNTPNSSSGSVAPCAKSSSTSSTPTTEARARSTAFVCGIASASTAKTFEVDFDARRATSMPSTTAVGSSSIEAFAVASPVRSVTIVWKLMSASSRPCEISGW
jgi:hypothetical protein